MEFRFNVTGPERKEFVNAVSKIIGWDAIYMKAPTFAYVVNNFTIDKNGMLICDDRVEAGTVTTLLEKLSELGFTSEDAPAAEVVAEHSVSDSTVDDQPVAGDPAAPIADADPAPDRLSIEMPLDGFDERSLDNLEKLVASKAALIRKSLGADSLEIVREEDRLCFPWFVINSSADAVSAYTQFIAALCEMAKTQKRVVAKEKPADSEKFAFRCFLLRLGFIGSEYSAARKILLANLPGSGAFKSGARKQPESGANADCGATAGFGVANSLPEALADAKLIHNVHALVTAESAADFSGGTAPLRCGECMHHVYYTTGQLCTNAGGIVDTSRRSPDHYTHYCLNAPSGYRKIKHATDWTGFEPAPKWCPLCKEIGTETAPNFSGVDSLGEALADAELIHSVNAMIEQESSAEESSSYRDCLACANSMSEAGRLCEQQSALSSATNPAAEAGGFDRLFCVVKQTYVSDNSACIEFNN